MTVFLGSSGRVEIERKASGQALFTTVNATDVNDAVNRFSIDFGHEQIITGDRIEIRTVGANEGETITWINDPSVDDSFTRYAHVDEAGGIRLYNTFSEALEGARQGAIQLQTPPVPQETKVSIKENSSPNCLAQIREYQITTNRETIDTTHLGEQYVKQYESGLIQGQGSLECFWTQPSPGGCDFDAEEEAKEFASYLARLCIRLVHGAAFHGYFYVYADDSSVTRSVWYESPSCVITNVAVTVSPSRTIDTRIDFVTNGPITLREGYLPSYLELEQSADNVGLEQGGAIKLDNTDS